MIVEPNVARSTVLFAPISTLSSNITLPIWGTLLYTPISLGAKPKPSAPNTTPLCRVQFFPITVSEYILQPENIVVLSPITELSPI